MLSESTVKEVLRGKRSPQLFTINKDELVYDAIALMARHNVGSLLVVEDERIIGIISERDYARKVVLSGRTSKTTRVREIMEPNVLYVSPDDSIEGCLSLMTEKRIRHLPVIENGRLIGMITMGDIVKNIISDQEFLINELVGYVAGSYHSWSQLSSDPKNRVEERFICRN